MESNINMKIKLALIGFVYVVVVALLAIEAFGENYIQFNACTSCDIRCTGDSGGAELEEFRLISTKLSLGNEVASYRPLLIKSQAPRQRLREATKLAVGLGEKSRGNIYLLDPTRPNKQVWRYGWYTDGRNGYIALMEGCAWKNEIWMNKLQRKLRARILGQDKGKR